MPVMERNKCSLGTVELYSRMQIKARRIVTALDLPRLQDIAALLQHRGRKPSTSGLSLLKEKNYKDENS